MPKSKRFDDLQSTSGVQGRVLVDNCPVGMPSALCPLSVQPYGQDPVFNPFSDIFDDDLPGLEGNYYNTTTVQGFSSRVHDVFSKTSPSSHPSNSSLQTWHADMGYHCTHCNAFGGVNHL